jgi:hypothetical protein
MNIEPKEKGVLGSPQDAYWPFLQKNSNDFYNMSEG